jgi:hypothetical protein
MLNYKFRNVLEFEYDYNLKIFKSFGKNPRNSPKLYHGMGYTNIIFDDINFIAEFNVPLQVAIGTFGRKLERLEFEFG